MASLYGLKPAFQRLLRPVTAALARAAVTANQVTLAALTLSMVAGSLVWWFSGACWSLMLIPVVLSVRMALNAIDGMLAREHSMKSNLGVILNELGDVGSDAAIYLPLATVPGISATLIVLIVVLAIIGEMTGILAIQIGAERRYDGPMGKSDRAFAFGSIALLLGLGVTPGVWLDGVLMLIMALLVLTIVNRARQALLQVDR